jgi:hypothetical protein
MGLASGVIPSNPEPVGVDDARGHLAGFVALNDERMFRFVQEAIELNRRSEIT